MIPDPLKRLRKRRTKFSPPGSPPGMLIPDPEAPRPRMQVIAYGPEGVIERDVAGADDLKALRGTQPVLWLNVDGLGDVETLRRIGECFGLHPLSLEDVVNVNQRPKFEHFEGYEFVVARMVELGDHIDTEQWSLFLGEAFVLTFQERPGDCWDPVRARIRQSSGRLRQAGADYLAYVLLDAVIDSYFPVLETLGERFEALEEEVLGEARRDIVGRVHAVKRDLLSMRRATWPLREALNGMVRDTASRFTADTRLFLRDCYDHTIQVIDLVETYRELGSDLTDIYLSSASNRMSEVMKVLTVIATIFIPLTFIAGVYGMNFDPAKSPWNMPELRWRYGYPFSLALMAAVAGGMLLYFRRKGWLGTPRTRPRR